MIAAFFVAVGALITFLVNRSEAKEKVHASTAKARAAKKAYSLAKEPEPEIENGGEQETEATE